jgi:hypothetical protein
MSDTATLGTVEKRLALEMDVCVHDQHIYGPLKAKLRINFAAPGPPLAVSMLPELQLGNWPIGLV